MAGTVTASVLKNDTTSPPQFQNSAGTQIGQLARAWVNFTGATGTVNASFNVTSVTRNSTGNYTVNFTNAMGDANYSCVYVASNASGSPSTQPQVTSVSRLSTSIQVAVYNYGSGGVMDCTYNDIAVFR